MGPRGHTGRPCLSDYAHGGLLQLAGSVPEQQPGEPAGLRAWPAGRFARDSDLPRFRIWSSGTPRARAGEHRPRAHTVGILRREAGGLWRIRSRGGFERSDALRKHCWILAGNLYRSNALVHFWRLLGCANFWWLAGGCSFGYSVYVGSCIGAIAVDDWSDCFIWRSCCVGGKLEREMAAVYSPECYDGVLHSSCAYQDCACRCHLQDILEGRYPPEVIDDDD